MRKPLIRAAVSTRWVINVICTGLIAFILGCHYEGDIYLNEEGTESETASDNNDSNSSPTESDNDSSRGTDTDSAFNDSDTHSSSESDSNSDWETSTVRVKIIVPPEIYNMVPKPEPLCVYMIPDGSNDGYDPYTPYWSFTRSCFYPRLEPGHPEEYFFPEHIVREISGRVHIAAILFVNPDRDKEDFVPTAGWDYWGVTPTGVEPGTLQDDNFVDANAIYLEQIPINL